jgi:hypothetical protein
MRLPSRSSVALRLFLALALLGLLGAAAPARADEKEAEPTKPGAAKLPWLASDVTRVATAIEEDKPVEAFLSVSYEYMAKRAAIKREWELNSTTNGYGTFKDLRYKQDRHTLRLRGEIGFLWDLSFHVEAPIVLSDQRSLGFDQDLGSNCVYPQDVVDPKESPSCVNELNSATLRDGIVPGSFGQLNSAHGFDAKAGGQMFQGGDPTVFRGIRRAGLESLNLGVDWALLAQRKDDTKPTWVISAEFRLSLGTPMRFDRTAYDSTGKYLGSNTVTDGVHWVRLGTSVSKRWTYVEPYAMYYWMYPMVIRDSAGFKNYGAGEKGWKPQQHAGTQFGLEIIPWENRKAFQKITIDLRGIIEAHFQGRGYSEIWEMLAGSPALDPQGSPSDANGQPLMKPGKGLYPGITDIENYFTYGGQLGLTVRAGRYLKFRGFFGVQGAQRHIITFADAGRDLDNSGKVEQQGAQAAAEVNPVHRPLIDFVGRRYVVDETTIYTVMLQGEAVF